MSFQSNGFIAASLSLGHLVHLTLLRLILFILGVRQGCCARDTNTYDFSETSWGNKIRTVSNTLYVFNNVWIQIENTWDILRDTHFAFMQQL
jgi:hypothetical protein